MTFAAAIVLGTCAGLLGRSRPRIAVGFAVLWGVFLGFQTWLVGSGHVGGDSRTIGRPGYWVFQALFFGVGVGLWALITVLARRAAAR
jgi:hypothetical protein